MILSNRTSKSFDDNGYVFLVITLYMDALVALVCELFIFGDAYVLTHQYDASYILMVTSRVWYWMESGIW